MKKIGLLACAGVSWLTLATAAFAQDVPVQEDNAAAENDSETIVIQARRRSESAQDVPLVVNAVTAESIQKLNLREFEEIENLVPGLSLGIAMGSVAAQASLRGVNFDANASGNNGTIEFYLNDAPLSAGILFQSMFDVGQIEVLRGPQGTLRGRASPSGSITVTTRRPDLTSFGGYATATLNSVGGLNANGAINVPIIADVLGIRVAGVVDEGEGNRVHSINNTLNPFVRTVGGRVSVRFEPADFISLSASYTYTKRDSRQFSQVESLSEANPSAPASPVTIRSHERLAVSFLPLELTTKFQVFNWQAQIRFAGQKLDYVGSHNSQKYIQSAPNDLGAFFGANFPDAVRLARQSGISSPHQNTHELRLSNSERLFGMFDYVIGGLYNKLDAPTILNSQTPLFLGIGVAQHLFVPTPAALLTIINTPVERGSGSLEKSIFGNVTAHLGESTELSAGARYINYKSHGFLSIGGVLVAAANEDRKTDAWIFSASAKHRFNEDFMVYASFGSSFRPGSATNPIILRENTAPSPLMSSLYFPPDEKSKSYEIGLKSDWFDKRVRLNVTAYHQDFKNYAYSARNIFFAGINSSGAQQVFQAIPAIAVAVPARVNGVEAEIGLRPADRWDIAATLSYSKSKIKNGEIPCNDYFPTDGIPDASGQVPTYAQVIAANGGEQVATCIVDYRAGSLPPLSATVQSEYSQPISPKVDGYVRGLLTFNGKSQNDPANAIDDVDAYALVNLFAGVRDPDGGWEVGAYVKNLFDAERVLSRDASSLNVSYRQFFLPPATTLGQTGISTYRAVTLTPSREFGITARVAFGSR